MSARRFFVSSSTGLVLLFAACVLNPHPLPPLEATSADPGANGAPSADGKGLDGAAPPEAADSGAPTTTLGDAGPRDAASDADGGEAPDGGGPEGGFDAGDAQARDALLAE